MNRCESCGTEADVVLADESTWCFACHASALRLGYDTDHGTLVRTSSDAPTFPGWHWWLIAAIVVIGYCYVLFVRWGW